MGDMALMTVPAVQESVSALWAAVQEAPRPCDTRALLARAEAAISACFHVAAPRLASATALSWSAVDGAGKATAEAPVKDTSAITATNDTRTAAAAGVGSEKQGPPAPTARPLA